MRSLKNCCLLPILGKNENKKSLSDGLSQNIFCFWFFSRPKLLVFRCKNNVFCRFLKKWSAALAVYCFLGVY